MCAGVNIHLEKKKICLHAFILKYMSNLCEFVIAAHEKDPRTLSVHFTFGRTTAAAKAALFGNKYAVFDSSVMGNSSY